MTHPLRILLADDHDVVRLGLRALLDKAEDMTVVGEAVNGREAVSMAQSLRPDVVVMDISMSEMDGLTATRELTRRQGDTRVLALTMHEEEAYLVPLLEAGAMGYVVKSSASSLLLDAVRTVACGHRFVRPQAARVLADELVRRSTRDELRQRHYGLSERERAVFCLIAHGYSASQIGERLHISAKTVDTYRRRINDKLDIGERADYVRLALQLDLLAPDAPDH
jgi:DNA-binding NarL/FixJ family response regulator